MLHASVDVTCCDLANHITQAIFQQKSNQLDFRMETVDVYLGLTEYVVN